MRAARNSDASCARVRELPSCGVHAFCHATSCIALHDLRVTGASSTATAAVELQPQLPLQPLSQPHVRSTTEFIDLSGWVRAVPKRSLRFLCPHIVCFDCVIQTDHVSLVPCHPSQVVTTVFARHVVRQLVRRAAGAASGGATSSVVWEETRALPPLSRRCRP